MDVSQIIHGSGRFATRHWDQKNGSSVEDLAPELTMHGNTCMLFYNTWPLREFRVKRNMAE